ncbi:hypothetical protein MSG28_009357 [Choristoneura fumiferana]|uniref:Uncharacterized protein n=1 Tax=Choristoneura fumiferana TaxID=7141 RepID=A0ACC0KX71_CHOFU|nr:hypothetical protein MSG28_009357 [Choristoneura fumiferana]
MACFKFEGDFETLSDTQLKLVESVLKKQGFNDGKVLVEPVGQKGDNYVANVIRFIYEKSDGSYFKMIGKVAPAAEELRKMMNTMILFLNEIVMYEEVLPKFNDLQNLAGVSANEKVRFPVCYGCVREPPNELILLEDLKESGFEMLDRFQPLSNDSVRVALKDLAKYHSLSYVLKNNEPETYNNISKKLLNMWALMDDDPAVKIFFEANENDMKLMVESEKHKKVIAGSLSQIATLAKKLQSYEKTSKYSVILQGDCWSNNILFKLEDGKAVENVMIDYQLSRESNPAADLLYFILNCTDYESRSKYYQEWIAYYHEMLDDALSNHGLKSNRVFPRDQLDADLRRYGNIMVSLGILLSSVLLRESKDVVDFKDFQGVSAEDMIDSVTNCMRAGSLDNVTIMKMKLKIEGIIDSALEFGLIQ